MIFVRLYSCSPLLKAAFGSTGSKSSGRKFRDSEFYMSHFQKDAITNKGALLFDILIT